jgi:hypothetical protein
MGLQDSVQKLARFAAIHKLSPQEYSDNLFYTIVGFESVNSGDVDCVLESLPEHARSALVDHVGMILGEDYRFHDLHYGGSGPAPDERERIRLLYQTRAKTFAALLRDRFNTSVNLAEANRESTL